MSSFVLVSSLLLLSELVSLLLVSSLVFEELEGFMTVAVAWMAICLSGFFSFPLPNVAVAIAVVVSASFPSPLAAAGFGSSDDDGSVIV